MAKIDQVTDESFEDEVLDSRIPVLVEFWADWCGPCKMAHHVLEQIVGTYDGKVRVVEVDTDSNPELVTRFDIQSIPTTFMIRDGEIIDHVHGIQSSDRYRKMLDKALKRERD